MKSEIIKDALHQRTEFEISLISHNLGRSKWTPVKERNKYLRYSKRYSDFAFDTEKRMLTAALARPEDIAENRNHQLANQIEKLTQSRVNRAAYYGRVLP